MRDLRDRVAVVTGGGSGIGRGTALALAARGMRLAVADVDGARAEGVAREVCEAGGHAIGVACDVARDADVDALRALVDHELGGADVVMSNVGVIASGRPEAIPVSEWARVLDVNVLSAARTIHAFVPGLLARGEGHLVFTASTAGLYTYAYDRLPYAASKGAVVALAEGLALYLRPQGIGVTCLCPGPVATNIVEQIAFSGEVLPIRSPGLSVLDPGAVGEMVAEAIVEDRFLLLTHPEVQDFQRRRAEDPEGFLAAQIEALAPDGEPS
jgi:NAD(P)-dependent dehydrogenase (short-subunit alcohol dehydrogenase family)